jgi:hypothetical protein
MSSARINIDAKDICVRMDSHARVALEFNRGRVWCEHIAFSSRGPQVERERIEKFERQFSRKLEINGGGAALRFLKTLSKSYLPGDGVGEILMEMAHMEATAGAGLKSLDLKGLVAHYNAIAQTLGKGAVKNFKSKGEALARIEKLSSDGAGPTPQQQKTKAAIEEKAAKRAATPETAEGGEVSPHNVATEGATPEKEDDMAAKKEHPTAKGPTKSPAKGKAKPAAKKPSAKGDAKPRGLGIGSYCEDLIMKGKSNEEVAEAARKKFGSKTSPSSAAWYRNKLRSEGKKVP